jgi:RND family efflux transporter MFP subunit
MADEARTHLGFTRIRAPHDGHVKEKRIDAGSMASPGMPLLVIEGKEDMYVRLSVDERLMDRILPGMPAELELGSPERPLAMAVRETVPAVDPLSRTFTVKVGVSGKGIASGSFTRVRIPLGMRDAILVPADAVVTRGQLTGVYIVAADNLVTFRLIRAGRIARGEAEVLSGLSPGERIITGHVERAADGGILVPGDTE